MKLRPGVPFVDLGIQTRQIQDEVREAWDEILRTSGFVLGPAVEAFESEFADYSGTKHAVGVGNGTDALELALLGAGIGPGDEVVVPVNTFVATAEAVVRAGADVVLADVDDDYLVDPEQVASCLTPRTRAVVAVHLYGQMAPIERLKDVVGEDVLLIEDAAQSQGASRDGFRSGSAGEVAGTSFYPGKNLGAFGDAGAVVTDRDDVAHRIRQLRNHGGTGRYEHQVIGTNSRLDALQAVVLSAKLRRLDGWNDQRRAAAVRYAELLGGIEGLDLPREVPGARHVWHLYVVRVADREETSRRLSAAGVGHGIHYPTPLHRLPALSGSIDRHGSFPHAERHASQILSLPMFPGITPEQQELVAESVVAAVTGRRTSEVVG